MSSQLLNAKNLTKNFGAVVALHDVSLSACKGDIIGLMGPNGAGKSTTLKFLSGYYKAEPNQVLIDGIDIAKEPKKAKKLIGYLPEESGVYAEFTGREWLTFMANIYGIKEQGIVADVAGQTGCAHYLDRLMGDLSKGMKQRLNLAGVLIHSPKILLLDEPTDGLDPNQKHEMRQLLKKISKNKSIIISTHALEEAEAICNRVVIISEGKIVADETPKKLAARAKGDMNKAFRKLTKEGK